jgi:hypothetical protein
MEVNANPALEMYSSVRYGGSPPPWTEMFQVKFIGDGPLPLAGVVAMEKFRPKTPIVTFAGTGEQGAFDGNPEPVGGLKKIVAARAIVALVALVIRAENGQLGTIPGLTEGRYVC